MTEETNGQLKLGENSLRYVEFPRENDFDWTTDRDVVVRHSPGIAVYSNSEGSVVLRQRDIGEDSFIIIRKEDVKRVVKAIAALANGQT